MRADAIDSQAANHAESRDIVALAKWDFGELADAIESRSLLWFIAPMRGLTGAQSFTDLNHFLDRKYDLIRRHSWPRILGLIDTHLLRACKRLENRDSRTRIELEALSFGIRCAKRPSAGLGSRLMDLCGRLAKNLADTTFHESHANLRNFLLDAAEAATTQLEFSQPGATMRLYEALDATRGLTPTRRARFALSYWHANRRDLDAKILYVKTLADTVSEGGAIPNDVPPYQRFALETLRVDSTVTLANPEETALLNQIAASQHMTWAEPWLWLGLCRQNDREGSRAMLARAARLAVTRDTKAEASFALANILTERGEFDAGNDHYTAAVEAGIATSRIAKRMGFALVKAKRWDEAIEQFERLETSGIEVESELYVQWGRALTMRNDTERARDRFMRALTLDGQESRAIRGLASCALHRGDERDAVSWLQRAQDNFSTTITQAINHPSHRHAEELVTLLVDVDTKIEPPEQLMLLNVLAPILTASFDQNIEERGTILRLCDAVQSAVERPLSWVTHTRALHALALGDLESASILVADSELPSTPEARALKKVVDLLNGEMHSASFLSSTVFDDLEISVIRAVPLLSNCHHLLSDAAARIQHRSSNAQVHTSGLVGPVLDGAPEWMRWLQVRATFLAAPESFLNNVESMDTTHPMVAWEICRIADAALPLGAENHTVVKAARRSLLGEDELAVHVSESWRGAAANLIGAELSAEREFQAIRCGGSASAARVRQYAALKSSLEQHDVLTRCWWSGQLGYWSEVATMSSGATEISSAPEISPNSWMWPRMLAQRAIAAIAQNDLPLANDLLKQSNSEYASTVYARALLASRTGATDEALILLGRLIGSDSTSVYAPAAQRLRAVLLERHGNARAQETYENLLRADADDLLTRQRYARLLFQKAYDGDPDAVVRLKELHESEPQTPMERSIATLVQIMFGSSDIDAIDETEHTALLRSRRRLIEGNVEGALSSLDATASSSAKLILQAATTLSRLAETTNRDLTDQKRDVTVALDALGQMDLSEHPGVMRWQSLLRTSLAILVGKIDPNADLLATIGSFENARSSMSQKALSALLREEGSIADHYRVLENELDDLPVPGADVWLRAARFRLQENDRLAQIEEQLPACVEDLEDDRVRWLIGLSFAKAGVECFKAGHIQDAHKLIARSRERLDELVQAEPTVADRNRDMDTA